MKTYKKWQKSDLDLDDYLDKPCEIDEELANYIGSAVTPAYSSQEFTQGLEAVKSKPGMYGDDEIYYYSTVSRIGDKYFYLGVLPEFRQ